MDSKQIIENNKLIAEFMGAKYEINNSKLPINELWLPIHGTCKYNTIELGAGKILNFHKSWDWIVQVLYKISNTTGFELIINPSYSYWNNEGENPFNEDFGGYDNIFNIYEAVVTFLKWYNTKN